MKSLEYYMSLPYKLEIVSDTNEGGFAARFPELPGCLTCANTMEEAVRNAEDAKREWIAAAIEDGYEIREPESDNNYSGQFKLRMPKSLHRSLAQQSAAEGISMNQYCLYLLSQNNAVRMALKNNS